MERVFTEAAKVVHFWQVMYTFFEKEYSDFHEEDKKKKATVTAFLCLPSSLQILF